MSVRAITPYVERRGMTGIPDPSKARSVWVAFHWDLSGLLIFDDELQARRFVDGTGMIVRNVPFGVDIKEFLQRE